MDPIDRDSFIGLPITMNGKKIGVVIDAWYDEDGLRMQGEITDADARERLKDPVLRIGDFPNDRD
jgi:hypothetical protein